MTNPDIARENYPDRADGLRPALVALFTATAPVALGYLGAIALAELVTTLVDPRLGLALHGATLFTMLIHAVLSNERRLQRLIFSLTLAPLIRLVSLSLPLANFPFAYWCMIVGIPLMLAAIVAARMLRVNRKMAGVVLGQRWPLQIAIGLSGLGLGYLEYLILRPEPLVMEFARWQMLAPALVLMVFTGFLEEYIFRGVMQYTAQRSLGVYGLVYISALFTALHIGYQSILNLAFVFAVALFFSLAAQKTSSLLGVSLAHGLTNIGLFLIFPFIVAAPLQAPASQTAPRPVVSQAAADQPALEQALTGQPPLTATPRHVSGPALWSAPPTHPPYHTTIADPTSTVLPSATPALTATPTTTPTLTPVACAPPKKWIAYTVKPGDSLAQFRRIYSMRKSELLAANCDPALVEVSPGQIFYLPYLPPTPAPVIKPTAVPAQPPGARPSPEPPASRP